MHGPTRIHPLPSMQEVSEKLAYCPETGVFTDLKPRINGKKASHPSGLGHIDPDGYHRIGISRRQHGAHKLAWVLFYGDWPDQEIDHINGDRADNRIANLRVCAHAENMRNRPAQRNNTSGKKGVNLIKLKCGGVKYRAKIRIDGKTIHLGCYDTIEDAHNAYMEGAKKYHGEFARAA